LDESTNFFLAVEILEDGTSLGHPSVMESCHTVQVSKFERSQSMYGALSEIRGTVLSSTGNPFSRDAFFKPQFCYNLPNDFKAILQTLFPGFFLGPL